MAFPAAISLNNLTSIELPFSESDISALIARMAQDLGTPVRWMEVVVVDEDEIVKVNMDFLKRNYVTDTISFNYNEPLEEIEGTIFCCGLRIIEQAAEYGEPWEREFLRVIIHGTLHTFGFEDGSIEEKTEMTRLENRFLDLM